MRRQRAVGALIVLLAAATAAASVVVRAGLADLATAADLIVDGTVRDSRVEMERDADGESTGRIWTVHEIEAGPAWKAPSRADRTRERLLVHVPGGRLGELEQRVSGAADLQAGDRYVLFLCRESGHWLVLGEAQGAFRVLRDAADGSLRCRNSLAGLALVDRDGRRVGAEPLELPLEDLRRGVREALEAEREAAQRREEQRKAFLEELRRRAERTAETTRGKPGGAE